MNLSTRAMYGLRLLYHLAREHGGPPLQLREVGEREGISEKYLGQIVILLKSAGIVQAVRGAQGGYYLSRQPGMISLLEIIEALEGEILPLDDAGQLSESAAAADDVRNGMRETIRGYLADMNLGDLLQAQSRRNMAGDYTI